MTGKPYAEYVDLPDEPAWATQDRDDLGRFTEHTDLLGHTVIYVDANDLV